MVEPFYLSEKGYAVHQIWHQCSLEYAKCTQYKLCEELWKRICYEVTTPKHKLKIITRRLGNGSSPIFIDTKTPAQSNFTTWYPGMCKIYPLKEIFRETIRFWKEIANIAQCHSGASFWLYWNTRRLINFPVIDTQYLLQYRYKLSKSLFQYVQVYGNYI